MWTSPTYIGARSLASDMAELGETAQAASQDWRYELKMVCEERAHSEVVAELRLHAMGFRPLYPDRVVQSIYLDTHEGRAVQDNLAGISDRSKFRLRWYGPGTGTVKAQMELKRRRNLYGCKQIEILPEAFALQGLNRLTFMQQLCAAVPANWRTRLERGLEPAQWIRYSRQYFGGFDAAVRITVDRELQACDLRDHWRIAWQRPSVLDRVLVVECKAAMSREAELREVVRDLRLKVDRCSKFVMASVPSHGPSASWRGW